MGYGRLLAVEAARRRGDLHSGEDCHRVAWRSPQPRATNHPAKERKGSEDGSLRWHADPVAWKLHLLQQRESLRDMDKDGGIWQSSSRWLDADYPSATLPCAAVGAAVGSGAETTPQLYHHLCQDHLRGHAICLQLLLDVGVLVARGACAGHLRAGSLAVGAGYTSQCTGEVAESAANAAAALRSRPNSGEKWWIGCARAPNTEAAPHSAPGAFPFRAVKQS
mmetsp:Transcript_50075/g.119123  ORF Transcript_50075/g.119123 Transcript_50075/m.119123 type:complete len:222 (+) Transcript_50075:1275-1940(+)